MGFRLGTPALTLEFKGQLAAKRCCAYGALNGLHRLWTWLGLCRLSIQFHTLEFPKEKITP